MEVGERERLQAEAQAMGLAFADLDRVCLRPETVALVSPQVCRERRILPLKRKGRTLWLAIAEFNLDSIRAIAVTTGFRIVPVVCLPDQMNRALELLK